MAEPNVEMSPPSTFAFGPREEADATRQAQQQAANDVPVDVNPNAIMARHQMGTLLRQADNFEAGASRRNIIADDIYHHRAGRLAQSVTP